MEKVPQEIAENVPGLGKDGIISPKGCVGCNNWGEEGCKVLSNPYVQHSRLGGCHMRTHNKVTAPKEDKKLNPLKASKRSGRNK